MRHTALIAATACALLVVGCKSSRSEIGPPQPDPDPVPQEPAFFASAASPSQEVGFDPQVGEQVPACAATFDFDGEDEIGYRINCHSLTGVTAAHIHRGSAKEEGPVVATLFENEDGVDVANGELASGSVTREDLGSEAFDSMLSDMLADGAYFNVHTQMNPPGEVRGHIVPTTVAEADLFMAAAMSGEIFVATGSPSQEVGFDPAVDGNPTCVAGFAYDGADEIDYLVHCDAIGGVIAAHIHRGSAKQEGPVTAFLFEDEDGVDVDSGELASGTLTREDLGSEEFNRILDDLRTDRAYFNVHTQTNPGGEVRGQIVTLEPPGVVSETFLVGGSPSQEVDVDLVFDGPVPYCGATFRYDGMDAIGYAIHCNDITAVTAAHIHRGSAKVNGPITVVLFEDAGGTGAIDGELVRGTVLRSALEEGAFDAVLDEMRTDTAYVNVHTQANPGGEARGQLVPIRLPLLVIQPAAGESEETFHAAASPSQEVDADPVVVGNPTCAATFRYDGADALVFAAFCNNITAVTAAHIHRGSAKENGPVTVTLFEGPVTGEVDGELASGTVTRDDLEEGEFDAVLDDLRGDNAYFNVHTVANLAGEVRGHIIRLQLEEDLRF